MKRAHNILYVNVIMQIVKMPFATLNKTCSKVPMVETFCDPLQSSPWECYQKHDHDFLLTIHVVHMYMSLILLHTSMLTCSNHQITINKHATNWSLCM